jgi:hypothetical protein
MAPWLAYDPDTGPKRPEDVQETVLFAVCRVLEGDVPRDADGLYRYAGMGADAVVYPLGFRVPALQCEVTGLVRPEAVSSALLHRTDVEELWGQWLAQVGGIGALIVLAAFVLVRGARRTWRRQRLRARAAE